MWSNWTNVETWSWWSERWRLNRGWSIYRLEFVSLLRRCPFFDFAWFRISFSFSPSILHRSSFSLISSISDSFSSLVSSYLSCEISYLSSDLKWKSKGERHFAMQRAFDYRQTVAKNWLQLHKFMMSKCLIQAQTDPLRILWVATSKRMMKCPSASWVEFNDVSSHW